MSNEVNKKAGHLEEKTTDGEFKNDQGGRVL